MPAPEPARDRQAIAPTAIQRECPVVAAPDVLRLEGEVGEMPREIPVHISSYLIDAEIVRGAMGVVYKARQKELNRTAADLCGRIGDKSLCDPLVIALGAETDPAARVAICGALARVGERSACPALVDALGDRDASVREAAAAALSSLTGQSFGADAAKWSAWLAGRWWTVASPASRDAVHRQRSSVNPPRERPLNVCQYRCGPGPQERASASIAAIVFPV